MTHGTGTRVMDWFLCVCECVTWPTLSVCDTTRVFDNFLCIRDSLCVCVCVCVWHDSWHPTSHYGLALMRVWGCVCQSVCDMTHESVCDMTHNMDWLWYCHLDVLWNCHLYVLWNCHLYVFPRLFHVWHDSLIFVRCLVHVCLCACVT